MLDAFIIEKIKQQEEEELQQSWQPLPLEISTYDNRQEQPEKKPSREIVFHF